MMRTIGRAVLLAMVAAPAQAQTTFPTLAPGVRAGGQVQLLCDTQAANCAPARGDATGAWMHAPPSTLLTQNGTIALAGGTATVVFVTSSDTEIVNPSQSVLWGSWGTPGVNAAGSYPIAPGGSYRPPSRVAGTFTLLSTVANQPYTATRF